MRIYVNNFYIAYTSYIHAFETHAKVIVNKDSHYIHIHRDDLHAHTICRVYIVQRNVKLRINKKNKTFRASPIGNKTKHHNTTLESNILSLNIYLTIYMYIYICIKLKFFFIFRSSIGKYFDK